MNFEVKLITPEIAAEFLENNYDGNRSIRQHYVHQLADVMKDGRFISENGQTIVLGRDGTLYDGQHRLSAIVESGCSQEMAIVFIDNAEAAYQTIDNGTKRFASDFLSGLKDKKACAAYGKVMACIEWGTTPLSSCLQGYITPNTNIDRGLVVSYCMQNADEVQDSVRMGRRMRGEVGWGSSATYATFIGVVRYCEKADLLDEFVDDFLSLAPSDATVIATKRALTKAGMSRRARPDKKWVIGTLLDGYTHYLKMDEKTIINKQDLALQSYSKLVEEQRGKEPQSSTREKGK